MTQEPTDRYYSLTSAAHYIGRSTRWLHARMASGTGPEGVKFGKTWMIKGSTLDRWIAQGDRSPDEPAGK